MSPTGKVITELQEELQEAKKIIRNFIWPSDCTGQEWQQFEKKAARFAGCTEPIFCASPKEPIM
jgi:hypothetical protein